MLSGESVFRVVFLNFIFMLMWHIATFVICRCLSRPFFNPEKFLYNQKKWENNGSFYVNILKIKRWKDYLPQFVSKNGFSKRSLKKNSELCYEYINMFIVETCRAEWNHIVCCFYFTFSFFVNSFFYGLIFSLVPIIANLPFIAIQRYNRIRLRRLCVRYKPNPENMVRLGETV